MYSSRSHLSEIERRVRQPTVDLVERLDTALGAGGALLAAFQLDSPVTPTDDELDALELTRRAEASDVGAETLRRLEAASDDLAMAYPVTAPSALLTCVKAHLAYIKQLLNGRIRFDEHERLLTVAG